MTSRPSPRTVGACVALLILTACSSTGGLITSLEDLSTESVKEGFVKIPQYRVASIPGWLPFADVGGLYFYKPSRKPASAIGLSPGASFELVSEIVGAEPNTCTETCLAEIRTRLTRLGGLATELVQARADLSLLQARQARQAAGAEPQMSDGQIDEVKNQYRAAQKRFDTHYEGVVDAIRSNGVLIYRWATDSSQSGGFGLGSLLGGSAQQDERRNGFALVSGIRTKTLFVGRDLLGAWPQLDKDSRFSNRFEITTHVMQARHILYGHVADVSRFAQARLQASYAQLANFPQALKELDEIEVSMALSKVSNLSNIGVMGNMKRSVVPIQWDLAALQNRFASDDWLTFYSVESDFTDMLALLRESEAGR